MIRVCAVIVTYQRPEWLKRCIESLLAAAAQTPELKLGILVGINGEDAASVSVVTELRSQPDLAAEIHISEEEARLTPARARNQLVQAILVDWLYFIDDDAFVPPDFFLKFLTLIKNHPQAASIGGPNLTPPQSHGFARAAGFALESRFATFYSVARYRAQGEVRSCGEESLILCNLFIQRSKMGARPFPEYFVCAEENYVLEDLRSRGLELLYAPELWVWHERRSSPFTFIKQVFSYAVGRAQNISAHPKSLRWAHLLPTIVAFAGLLLLSLGFKFHGAWDVLKVLASVYLFLAWMAAVSMSRRHFSLAAMSAFFIFPILHASYAAGLMFGFLRRD